MGRGTEVHDSVDEPAVETAFSEDDLAILRRGRPFDADFLISYSTCPEILSHRNIASGLGMSRH